jgi:hypothetical protein
MPCQYCNSSNHTLSGCNADIAMYSDAIKDFMETSSFGLRHQYQALNQFPRPILAIFCNRLGYRCVSLSKLKLIKQIITHYFIELLTIDPIIMQVASEHLRAEVGEAYRSLQMWNIDDQPNMCNFRDAMLSLLEFYHRKAFGMSYSQRLINDIIGRDGFATILPFAPVQVIPPPPPPAAAAAARSRKSHLKKLKIKVNVDANLVAQECFMCCDENKSIARLGCSHEYCVDCVVKCAKVRTKSFIVCAICRVEVEEVHVSDKTLKKTFVAQIKKE